MKMEKHALTVLRARSGGRSWPWIRGARDTFMDALAETPSAASVWPPERRRSDLMIVNISVAAFLGIVVLVAAVSWYLWRESITAEEQLVGGLAASLGARTEAMILDTRTLLEDFDRLPQSRCSPEHLQALQEAVIGRPYVRGVRYFHAVDEQCGVGFLQATSLKPPRADRIYDSGVVAWWPSPYTEVGGLRLFLMRFGDHDVAIDPRVLLDIGPFGNRQAGLWVENLLLTSEPADARLPTPSSVPVGVTVDRDAGRVVSRFSRNGVLPIDIVAIEPLATFWGRHVRTLVVGSSVGLMFIGAWVYGLTRYARHRLGTASLLRDALARGHIQPLYQPVIELATGRCVGAEALARWTTENGQVIGPATFLPVAEAAGLMPAVTFAMLDACLREHRALLREFPGLSIHLNLSPSDLKNDAFSDGLAERLRAADLPSRSIGLEITERALADADVARGMIRRFRERGHEVAVDDFGTGFSSLSYLSTFELDVLKIDKSFVDAIGTEAATSHVIVHVIEMARSLGLRTVAEGVEREDQVRWLEAHGVSFAQGFLFSRPLTAEAFTDFVRAKEAV
jgi:sensor c-di-GMP phosphodiesterase-like protein